MKIKLNTFYVVLLLGLLNSPFLASADTFEINSPTTQQSTITSPGFFPFSSISNDAFKKDFPEDMTLDVSFSNFLGGPCTIAPAADFAEIGSPFTVTGNSDFILDFSMASPNAGTFGLSFVPKGSPCTFNIQITTPSTSSSGSTSTSSGGTASTNEDLISNAIFLETLVKKSLSSGKLLDTEININDLESSLSILNELNTRFSSDNTSTSSLIQKKITCASEADNQVTAILKGLKDDKTTTSDDPLFHKSISKANKLLNKALRCKKTIQKKI